jgi:hypothetical protein
VISAASRPERAVRAMDVPGVSEEKRGNGEAGKLA